MRKVLIFVLTLVLALGGLGYAHAAVTESQDDLLIYPSFESGDPAVLAGRTASLTFACGDHLRWYADYTFGGETQTEFLYIPEGIEAPESDRYARLDVYFSGGMGASTSGGEFSPTASGYGDLLKAVAATIGPNESRTMNLRMADYVDEYLPDYELSYLEGDRTCDQQMSLHALLTGDSWYETPEAYQEFFEPFTFPVQEDQIISVTVYKDDAGRIVSIDLAPENGPILYYVSDVNAEGVWFVPVFRSETGEPLAYGSPEGHGLYFAPWKEAGTVARNHKQYANVTPDMDQMELVIPLEEDTVIEDMTIDADAGRAWLLSLEETGYILTQFDLSTGAAQSLEVMPHDSSKEWSFSEIIRDSGYLLLTAQDQLALVEEDSLELLLTATDEMEHSFFAAYYEPENSELYFENGTLILLNTDHYRSDAFWTAVYRQGGQVYYGELDCSLLRGNDDFYYREISTYQDVITLK